jgi:parallel beta-helix repeat protein
MIIDKNTCNNNHRFGIRLQSSNFSTVVNNKCNSNNEYGIYLRDSVTIMAKKASAFGILILIQLVENSYLELDCSYSSLDYYQY